MKPRIKEILIALNCLVLNQNTTIAYESTIPDISAVECVTDKCGSACVLFASDCASMYGCGYDGAGEAVDACTTYSDTSKHVDEKNYRLT